MTEFRQLSDLDAYCYINNIFGMKRHIQQDCNELLWFLNNARTYLQNVNLILEIGSLYGNNLCMLSRLLNDTGTIISIEPELEYKSSLDDILVKEVISPIELKVFKYTSKDAFTLVKEFLGERKINSFFIDGDHSYEGVKYDFETYSPFVNSPGIIGIHDIMRKDSVGKFWEEIKSTFPNSLECLSSVGIGTGICFL